MAGGADETADVAVVGGGPGGAAAALTLLNHTALSVVVIERTACAEPRVGEAVSSALAPLLRYLGVEAAFSDEVARVPSRGVRASWGAVRESSRDAVFSTHGHGWHLDRLAFDRMLLGQVSARGGRVWLGSRPSPPERLAGGGWALQVTGPEGRRRLLARVVVEASGRVCGLGRSVGARPRGAGRLVALVGRWAPASADAVREELTVETCEAGWWYTAPLPAGGLVAALMTDSDLVRPLAAARPDGWARLLADAPLTRSRLGGGRLEGPLTLRSARPQVLEPVAGPGWIAAGDAATAHDPLSSLGIGHAVASGVQAARVLWSDWEGGSQARDAYAADVRASFERHLAACRATYGGERRWRSSTFWQRRTGDAAPSG